MFVLLDNKVQLQEDVLMINYDVLIRSSEDDQHIFMLNLLINDRSKLTFSLKLETDCIWFHCGSCGIFWLIIISCRLLIIILIKRFRLIYSTVWKYSLTFSHASRSSEPPAGGAVDTSQFNQKNLLHRNSTSSCWTAFIYRNCWTSRNKLRSSVRPSVSVCLSFFLEIHSELIWSQLSADSSLTPLSLYFGDIFPVLGSVMLHVWSVGPGYWQILS